MTRRNQASNREPTPRQIECFETYAKLGDGAAAARQLGISLQQLKRNCGEYYRRVGANSGIQAAFMRWGRPE